MAPETTTRASLEPAELQIDVVVHHEDITRIDLETEAQVPGIDDATFQKHASDAKQNCPLSKALAATEIHLTAKLI